MLGHVVVTDEAHGDISKRGWAKNATLETDLRLLSPVQSCIDNTRAEAYSVFKEIY